MKEPSHSPATIKPLRILVIDDVAQVRKLIRDTLQILTQAKVHSVANSKAALSLLEETEIHLITQDLTRRDGTGLEFLEIVKSNPKTRHIPVIIISANPKKVLEQAWRAGASAVVSKPYVPYELIEIINHFLLLGRNSGDS